MPTDFGIRFLPSGDSRRSERLVGGFGVASGVLLGASFVWAHHWGPLAYVMVAGWALATLAGIVSGALAFSRSGRRGWFPRAGLVCTAVSVLVFLGTTAAFATGHDPVAACGGG
jgi:hypothetical protein